MTHKKRRISTLLLASIYGLNNSFTKKILVGIKVKPFFKFEPVMRLVSHSAQGISFDSKTWNKLQNKLEFIRTYIDHEASSPMNKKGLELGKYRFVFTTAYGCKAIVFKTVEHQLGAEKSKKK